MDTQTPETAPTGVERMTYNVAEACQALGVSYVTLYRLEAAGRIRSVPGIRKKLYPVESLRRFVAGKVGAA